MRVEIGVRLGMFADRLRWDHYHLGVFLGRVADRISGIRQGGKRMKWLKHLVIRWQYYRRERWEYQTFNTTDMPTMQTFGSQGWEIIQVGWGKSPYNMLAKRRLRWFQR